jgi:O-antigen/teichoic acid export membrane protein
MLITMGVSLYNSRIVLATLGVEDYGIYNVVGGVVALFSLMSGSLSAAIVRFITFEMGRNDFERLKSVFSTSVTIQWILSVTVVILAETVGVWFLNAKMNIPEMRMTAANWVLQVSIATFVVNLLSIPYNAAIVAREHMKTFAYVGIVEVVLKLIAVYLLQVSPFDKLVFLSMLILLISICIQIIYLFYCKRHFKECTYRFVWNKPLLKTMMNFSGWNFIGSSASILKEQGVNIVLNLFYGTFVNAARGVAVQVNSAVTAFTQNFMTALNPQITKSYASNERDYMMTLIYRGARFSFYLLLLLSLPIIIDAEYILSVWLKIVPEHASGFVRLILLLALCESLSGTLITAMLATGKIKKYQIIVGGIQMMNLPLSYLFLQLGGAPEGTILIAIIISQACLLARLWLSRKMIQISAVYYVRHVYLNVIAVFILSAILPILLFMNMDEGPVRLLSVGIVSIFSTMSVIFFVGCSKNERMMVHVKLETVKSKFYRKWFK